MTLTIGDVFVGIICSRVALGAFKGVCLCKDSTLGKDSSGVAFGTKVSALAESGSEWASATFASKQ